MSFKKAQRQGEAFKDQRKAQEIRNTPTKGISSTPIK